jgi:energy-coupling factor transporter transmembrane protein EcfT
VRFCPFCVFVCVSILNGQKCHQLCILVLYSGIQTIVIVGGLVFLIWNVGCVFVLFVLLVSLTIWCGQILTNYVWWFGIVGCKPWLEWVVWIFSFGMWYVLLSFLFFSCGEDCTLLCMVGMVVRYWGVQTMVVVCGGSRDSGLGCDEWCVAQQHTSSYVFYLGKWLVDAQVVCGMARSGDSDRGFEL